MNGYLFMGKENIIEKEKYQKQITSWFETVAFSNDKELANMAIVSLAQNYSRRGQYEEAQKLLDKVPPAGFDKRIIQADLYSKQGNYNKAYEMHESMIYQYANSIMNNIMQIITILCEEEKYQEALEYADLAAKAAEYFALGEYIGQSAKLTIYLNLQDEEKCLQILEKIMSGIDSIKDTKKSKLYSHLKFKEDSSIDEMKTMILKSLENDKEVDFLRDNPRFKAIFNF